jgi:hypothetical protein
LNNIIYTKLTAEVKHINNIIQIIDCIGDFSCLLFGILILIFSDTKYSTLLCVLAAIFMIFWTLHNINILKKQKANLLKLIDDLNNAETVE